MEPERHATADAPAGAAFDTDIPARLDRLPWSRFHWLLVIALGASWAIDGLEVTLKGAVSGVLQDPASLHLDAGEIGALASFYLIGAVTGALFFGWLTDRHGRSRLFFITLAVYLTGTLLTAFSWDFASLAAFRCLTGFGIGGEYAAINSAIDELIPARLRGRINLIINGSFWLGAMVGSGATVLLLDPAIFAVDTGWRVGFGIGATLGFVVLLARAFIPESPRWLSIRGRRIQAEQAMAAIEAKVQRQTGKVLEPATATLTIHPRHRFGLRIIFSTLFGRYRQRAFLCFVLIASQAFLYNAIFFTYALVLTRFYDVPAQNTGLYLLPFAIGNFLGPLLMGHYFDSLGRRAMISGTYAMAATLLLATGAAFVAGTLSATGQTAAWAVIFFFASAAASSAYLTISEVFPLELRALAIAVFYSLGTAAGGIVAPWLFGLLIGSGDRLNVFWGYALGAGLMYVAALVELRYGVRAEQASLEAVAAPLSAEKS
ncbi:MAG: MFS transporter [Gammaproteobacteria bacterium]|nr:MFS transporter [Gammaproteobacteria bacterium]MBU1414087.1 MFS transporter [Gammaproteobacteria bacterium]